MHTCAGTHTHTYMHTHTHTHKNKLGFTGGQSTLWTQYHAAWKIPYSFHLLLGSFPSIALETVPMFMMVLSHLFKKYCQQERLSRVYLSPLYTFLLRVVSNVVSLALCPLVVSQAPQHFRSSEVQASCGSCSARQSVSGYFP